MEQQKLFKDDNVHIQDKKIRKEVLEQDYIGHTTFNVKLFNNEDSWMPTKAKKGDTCFDLKARFYRDDKTKDVIDSNEWYINLEPGQRGVIGTGVFLELKEGWEAQIRSRSGMALSGLIICNGIGSCDSSYRGEICVIIQNNNINNNFIEIKKGDRIAQMAIKQVPEVILKKVEQINETERGMNGFGSTGVK